MNLPLSWISLFTPTDLKPQEIADRLTVAGVKVENVHEKKGEHIFEFEITTNRGDELGVLGIARELSAVLDKPLRTHFESKHQYREAKIEFTVDPVLCPSYAYFLIENVLVGSSPKHIAERLTASGIRDLANVIDVTNYAMLETGIPMHAFDYDKIKGRMSLRAAKKGEKLTTLDDSQHVLPEGAIIIEDDEKIFDLAGIMGGKNSEVDDKTKTVLLFVPIYNHDVIRRTSKAIGLRTEASARYEKKLDHASPEWVGKYAAEMIAKLTGGHIVSSYAHMPQSDMPHIEVSLSKLNKTIGYDFKAEEVKAILKRLGFEVSEKEDVLNATPPTFRPDVLEFVDIVEEVTRIYGFNNLPLTLPTSDIPMIAELNWDLQIRQLMIAMGFTETFTYTLVSPELLSKAGFTEGLVKLENPMSSDYSIMRPSLLPSLLFQVSHNLHHRQQVSLFEVGKVFSPQLGEYELPTQPVKLTAVTTVSLEKVKSVLENLRAQLKLGELTFKPGTNHLGNENSRYDVYLDKEIVGSIAEVAPEIAKNFDIKVPVYYVGMYLDRIRAQKKPATFSPLPKHPYSREDIAVSYTDEIPAADIIKVIEKASKLVIKSEVSDVYKDKGDKTNLTFRIWYYDPKQTLTSEQIATERAKILAELKKSFRLEFR